MRVHGVGIRAAALTAAVLALLALAAAPAFAASAPSVDAQTTSLSTRDISTSEILQAQINPNELDTTYHFEYGTTTAYGTSAPVPDADIGAGTSDVAVSQRIAGLALNTTYHFRVVATSSAGTTDGADMTFTTGKGFGVASFSVQPTNQDGSLDTQAGSTPYELTTEISFNTVVGTAEGNVKDVITNLPPGLIGNPAGIPQCTQQQLAGLNSVVAQANAADCPAASQVGVMNLRGLVVPVPNNLPVYNMVPPRGEVAQFGINVLEGTVLIDFKVRTGGDYGVTATVSNASTLGGGVASTSLTLWGVPADPTHDSLRQCPGQQGGGCPSSAPLTPLLSLPTSCTGPLTSTVSADDWQNPGNFVNASYTSQDFGGSPVALSGCSQLPFDPSIAVQPDTTAADSPSGLSVDLHLPQHTGPLPGIFTFSGSNPTLTGVDYSPLATADLRDAAVTLPAGVSVNPSSAAGLQACTPAEIGVENASEPSCPEASKIGTVEVDTPLLPNPLKGGVYVAQQNDNPFGSLLAIYVTAEDPVSGVLVKLAGHIVADPVTGQLQTTFSNNPQLPFTDFKPNFFGGPHAALATPGSCGTYSTTSDLSPWSGGPDALSSDPFTIEGGCVSGFSPAFTAGTVSNQAGAFSPFLLSFSRGDNEQQVKGLTFTMPPGVSAKLAGVPRCSDADANAGTCPEATRIGSVTAGSGVGPDPYFLKGSVYLTGPYNGGPFGEVVVVPAIAGPFNLGNVVVRGSIRIDRTTAQPTVVSDPFPQFVGSTGIPTDIKRVDVNLDRPGFTFNPTDCEALTVTGTLTSTGGASAAVSQRFQAAGCASLAFKPKLTASTSGRSSRANGTSLDVKLSFPRGAFGKEANVRSVKVVLPRQLASRLSTLSRGCRDYIFEEDPAKCPAESRVGAARASTPVLSAPLTGPAYFVSHGGRKFPELVVVLQGEGVIVKLQGETFISPKGITSSTFRMLPDVPVESFELKLPKGPFSALGANGRLCKGGLQMPTALTAQNGLVIHQSTPISVSGCAKHKTHRRRHRR